MSLLQVRSEVCIAPLHVRSKVCIAPFHVQSKVYKFAPHMDGSHADFAPHMEESHADIAPHMEHRHSCRDHKIAKFAIFANFQKDFFKTTYVLGVYMTYATTFENKELFENAPPYMIIRPSFKGGVYINSGQISKLIVKLTYIHVQLLTKPLEYYDKSVSYTFASLHKSI